MRIIVRTLLSIVLLILIIVGVLQWPSIRDPMLQKMIQRSFPTMTFERIEGIFPLRFTLHNPKINDFQADQIAIVVNPWNWSHIPVLVVQNIRHPKLSKSINAIRANIDLKGYASVQIQHEQRNFDIRIPFKRQKKMLIIQQAQLVSDQMSVLGDLTLGAINNGDLAITIHDLSSFEPRLQGSAQGRLYFQDLSQFFLDANLPHLQVGNIQQDNLSLNCALSPYPSATCQLKTNHIELAASWSPQGTTIQTAQAQWQEYKLKLLSPVHLTAHHHSNIHLGLEQGRIHIEQSDDFEKIIFQNVPLIFHHETQTLNPKDRLVISGEGTIQPNTPQWNYHFKLTTNLPYVQAQLQTQITGNRHHLNWTLETLKQPFLKLKSQGEMDLDHQTLAKATINGQGNLKILDTALSTLDRYEGLLNLDLHLAGPMTQPHISGKVHVQKGVYENNHLGLRIQNIILDGHVERSHLNFTKIYGEDVLSGQVHGHGHIDFSNFFDPLFDLTAKAQKLALAQTDEIRGLFDGQVTLKGRATKAQLSGHFDGQSLSYRFERQGQQPTRLKIKGHQHHHPQQSSKTSSQGSQQPWIPTHLTLNLIQPLLIEGGGLKSQWTGNLKVQGNLDHPYLEGHLKLEKGRFEFFGKRLDIYDGNIGFERTHPNDPMLNIKAQREGPEVNIFLKIHGYASNPSFDFDSTPALPKEDIISRLLFEKSIAQINAMQNVQIAGALASASTQSPLSILDRLSGLFGFDTLEFKSNEIDPTKGVTQDRSISLGKNINEKIRIHVDKSVSGNEGKLGIEVKLTPRFSLEADVGGAQSTGVGINWSKRY